MASISYASGTKEFHQFCMKIRELEKEARENGYHACARLLGNAVKTAGDERIESLSLKP